MSLLLLACGAMEERPPLPEATTATELRVEGPDGALVTRAMTLVGREARAAETAAVKDEGGTPLEISSARSTWDLRAKTARFEEQVVLTRGDVTLTCTRLDVSYVGDRIERVLATGDVRVIRGEREARAENAELLGKNGQITLTGHPTLREGPNTLVGVRIRLFLDDETATCEGGDGGPCRLTVAASALP